MKKSEFDLIGGKYIYRADKIAYYVIHQDYASPLLDKIREIEATVNPSYASAVLANMEVGALKNSIRKAHNLDAIRAQQVEKDARGVKYTCVPCEIKFYDLNKTDAVCPKCSRGKNDCVRIITN